MTDIVIYDQEQLLREIALTRASEEAARFGPDETDVVDQPDDFDLSSGESSRAKTLKKIYRDPRGDKRAGLHGTGQMVEAILGVVAIAPHFREALGIFERAVHLSVMTERPLSVPPILLLGAPGLGKTFVAARLADALQTSMARLAMNAISETNLLLGHPTTWRGAKVGLLTRALIDSATASPVFFMDEIDKLSAWPYEGHAASAPLLSVLESENARACRDEYLCVDFDLSHAIIVATANAVEPLHPAIRDRFLVVEVEPPDEHQLLIVARSVYRDVAARYCGETRMAPDDVLAALARVNPRSIGRVIALALGFAAADKRRTPSRGDVERATAIEPGAERNASSLKSYLR